MLGCWGFVKTLGAHEELNRLLKHSSAVDLLTWKTVFKVGVAEELSGGAFIAHFGGPLATEAFATEVKRSLRLCGSAIPSVVRDAIRAAKECLEELEFAIVLNFVSHPRVGGGQPASSFTM